jgi:adenylate cyclase
MGAEVVGFDVLFKERHPPDPSTDLSLANGLVMASDNYFAVQLQQTGNAVLAVFGETLGDEWRAVAPDPLFRTNALAMGLAVSEDDADGVLRRVRPYQDDPVHGRIWQLGIVMACRRLGLDLEKAEVRPDRIVLRGQDGMERVLPLDEHGRFLINWQLTWNDPRLAKTSFQEAAGFVESPGDQAPVEWAGKLVFVGSIGTGNNISDVGTTPLAQETYLVSKHWNLAHSILQGAFIHRAPWVLDYLLIILMGVGASVMTMKLRAPWPTLLVGVGVILYVVLALALFLSFRFWLPLVLPLVGGVVAPHGCLVAYQVLFEQKEKRRVQNVFSKVVSPDVVHELLQAKALNLGGVRRNITVLFTDVRGFTEMTNTGQEQAELYVNEHGLVGPEAEDHYNRQAAVMLSTVNDYLGTIARQIKKHQGTLDKYIGDCVMAFWGAPIENPDHAASCVRAAIDAQRAIYQLNKTRANENLKRQELNQELAATGKEPLALLSLLTLGTGINTGISIVGLMGSEDHILNYTVFGPGVNLASRLESVSGRGRIIIGESTFHELERFDPALANTCQALPEVVVKGIRTPVKIYEVPWKEV